MRRLDGVRWRDLEGARSGKDSSAERWTQGRLAQDHTGKKGAERERNAQELRRREGHAQRDRKHRQPEKLP